MSCSGSFFFLLLFLLWRASCMGFQEHRERSSTHAFQVSLHFPPERPVAHLQWIVPHHSGSLPDSWTVPARVAQWSQQSRVRQTHLWSWQGNCDGKKGPRRLLQTRLEMSFIAGQDWIRVMLVTLLCDFAIPESHENADGGKSQGRMWVRVQRAVAVRRLSHSHGWSWTQTLRRSAGFQCHQSSLPRGEIHVTSEALVSVVLCFAQIGYRFCWQLSVCQKSRETTKNNWFLLCLFIFIQVLFSFWQILEEYNESHTAMNLVLFDDALDHPTRVHRIMRMDQGHALLVGVGGSGKQSICRLAAFTAGCQVSEKGQLDWTLHHRVACGSQRRMHFCIVEPKRRRQQSRISWS